MTSPLEKKFCWLWVHVIKGPTDVTLEHKFHTSRKWRFDFAHLPTKTAIEIEGGIAKMGRHQRPDGFRKDAEKYLEAGLMGWRVFRLTPDMINSRELERIASFIKEHSLEINQTNYMKADTRKGFKCECGTFHPFSVYVFANWTIALTHKCDCGREHAILSGNVSLIDYKPATSQN